MALRNFMGKAMNTPSDIKTAEQAKGWAIIGAHGLYTGWWQRRHEAIDAHCEALGKSWDYCKAKGDRVVKIKITVI